MAFVLLSGGLDSTTCLHIALRDFGRGNVSAVSIHYGQRHQKESEYARKSCYALGVPHDTIEIPAGLLGGRDTMLTNPETPIPDVSYADIPVGVSFTYVPYRNGNLLSLIAAYAQRWVNAAPPRWPRESSIYFGAHSEDAHNWAYPDCTPEFIGSQANAIYVGSYHRIRLRTPLMWLFKRDIVTIGQSLGVDFSLTWSCYKGQEKHCGLCPTCRSRKQAFIDANVPDPTEYAS